MTVVRKPSYALASFIDRATWIPLVQDIFTRMWLVLAAGVVAIAAILSRWRDARPSDRLLVLWVLVGLLELTIHDSGAERRYVMFIPAFVALTATLIGDTGSRIAAGIANASMGVRFLLTAIAAVLLYVAVGSALRPAFLDHILAGDFRGAVRLSAALAGLGSGILFLGWRHLVAWAAVRRVPAMALLAVVVLSLAWDSWSYARWADTRTDLNYRASQELGRVLPPGTLVHGKLANGLSLENQMRPVFVGRGFGNYADRFDRDDVRYILTYVLPREGYESQPGLIQEILDRYPDHRAISTFDVDETPGLDRAALIEKRPSVRPEAVSGS
jgi:hypothetical protein